MERDRVSKVGHVLHQAAELTGRESDRTGIGYLRNLQMLTVNVHQFHSVLRLPGTIGTFKGDSQRIAVLCMGQENGIGRLRTLHNLGEIDHIDSQGNWLGTGIHSTGIGQNGEIHESHMGRVHRLEFYALLGTQQIYIGHQFLNSVQNALQECGISKAGFKHDRVESIMFECLGSNLVTSPVNL